jgi:hypothetical protein
MLVFIFGCMLAELFGFGFSDDVFCFSYPTTTTEPGEIIERIEVKTQRELGKIPHLHISASRNGGWSSELGH